MRLILTTIIMTMLVQPVWAYTTEYMYSACSKWKEVGFSQRAEIDINNLSVVRCAVYMQAISQVGMQNCDLINFSGFQFEATAPQLAQAFLNVAEENPQDWRLFPYSILMREFGKFPCKE